MIKLETKYLLFMLSLMDQPLFKGYSTSLHFSMDIKCIYCNTAEICPPTPTHTPTRVSRMLEHTYTLLPPRLLGVSVFAPGTKTCITAACTHPLPRLPLLQMATYLLVIRQPAVFACISRSQGERFGFLQVNSSDH
jgi:hypothetical protein